jgi:hypothetical protein
MEMTVKQNLNTNNIVFKHKIALEAITLLEGRVNLLYTDVMVYTMVSFVDNCIEENLIELINNDEKDFVEIVEFDIEPKFEEIIKDEQLEALYYEILEYVDTYITQMDYKRNTAIGLINEILDVIMEMDWNDLTFFFQELSTKAKKELGKTNEPKVQKVTPDEFEGADAKMKALIQKFQREGQELQKAKESNE